ncbi:hypothetical protein ACWEOO_14865 [Kribbella sp. NPDC004138]
MIATLDGIPDGDPYEVEPTIFMRKPWTAYSEAVVLNEDAVNGVAPSAPDFTYPPGGRPGQGGHQSLE